VKPIRLAVLAAFSIGVSVQAQQPDAQPVNLNATPAARALLKEIHSVSGKATLSGEHNFPYTVSRYSDRVYELTGHYPAVFGQDFGFSTDEDKDSTLGRGPMIQEVIRQYRAGSVIALCWHAVRPIDDEPVTFHDSVQGKITEWEFQQVLTPGTALHARWERQVDRVAGYLRELQDAGVPVLFRPYHEMNGNWFWWGGRPGPNGTAALYRMIFDRYVHVHHLNNLIWVWNVNAPSANAGPVDQYWPGPAYADVVAMDIYGAFEQSYYDSMLALAGDQKPIALAEVGTMPTLEVLAKQPRWTYMMMWSSFEEGANSPAQLQAIFHAPNIVDRGDPRLAPPAPAPTGPPVPQDLNASPAARAMLARLAANDMTGTASTSGTTLSSQFAEIDISDLSTELNVKSAVERVRNASKAGQLPLLRWMPLSPTGKDGVSLDGFEWSELRRVGSTLNTHWQNETAALADLLAQLQAEALPVLLSAMPVPNSDTQWWGAHTGSDGSQALIRELHQSFAAQQLNSILWIWEPASSAPSHDPVTRSARVEDFYPGPFYADAILLDRPEPGKDQGRGLRMLRQLSGPKPVGVRTATPISADAAATFDFVVNPPAVTPVASNTSPR
jgi:mannan endo-1,4-beta-mannosidase